MAEYLIQDTTLTAIANAIRAKTGGNELIDPVNMAAEIEGISSGGGAPIPCMFMASAASMYVKYAASSGLTASVSVNIPADATVIGQYSVVSSGISQYSTSLSKTSSVCVGDSCNSGYCSTTSSVSGTTRTLTFTDTISKANNSSYPVVYGLRLLSVIFTMPGIYKIGNSAGTMDIYTDETVTALPTRGTIMVSVSGNIGTVDLSKSIITTIPSYFLYGTRAAKVIFPPCLTEIKSYALTTNVSGTVYDFSQAQSVPTLANSSAISCLGDNQILVPAALYDEWIAATNWSTKADYIVAV